MSASPPTQDMHAPIQPAKTAVLALDLQRHMVHADSPLARHIGFADQVAQRDLIAKSNQVLDAARAAALFVGFVGVDLSDAGFRYPRRGDFCKVVAHEHAEGKLLRPGNWEHALHEDVSSLPDEPIIYKRHIGAFAGSDLDQQLRSRGIEEIVLLGVATNFVVMATAWTAVSLGYGVIVLEDVCASISEPAHDQAIDTLRSVAEIWTLAEFKEALATSTGFESKGENK